MENIANNLMMIRFWSRPSIELRKIFKIFLQGPIIGIDPAKDPLLPRQESRDAELLNIVERIELGEMSRLYFNQIGRILFYLVIVIYLFGDLGPSSKVCLV